MTEPIIVAAAGTVIAAAIVGLAKLVLDTKESLAVVRTRLDGIEKHLEVIERRIQGPAE
jgi:hypothetical protein